MEFFHDILLGHTRSLADAAAIATLDRTWTYGELARAAEGFAARLAAAGVCSGDRVSLIVEGGHEAIALIAACSMLGAAFVPLDPGTPPERLRDLVRAIDPALVVAGGPIMEPGGPLGVPTAVLDREALRLPDRPVVRDGPPPPKPLDTGLAYLVFTSGSTGRPKGIMMSHLAAVSFLRGLIDFYRLPPTERYASCSPLHFDYALLDIGLCLGSGGTLVLPRRHAIRKPAAFVDELVRLGVRHVSGVPSIWKLILRYAPDAIGRLAGLRRIAFAGEHFPIPAIRTIYDALPDTRFVNIYGQSETIACAFAELPRPLPDDCKDLPVGPGHPDLELFLLDEDSRPLTSPYATGELYLRGKCLFSGYWDDPSETSRRLIPHPLRPREREPVFRTGDLGYFDRSGVFHFVGRKDNQVQIYGNRVELEEVESALSRHRGVAQCCVVPGGDEDESLDAFIVALPRAAGPGFVDELREHCARLLPGYMRPCRYHLVDRLPLTSSGKTDRAALRASVRPGSPGRWVGSGVPGEA